MLSADIDYSAGNTLFGAINVGFCYDILAAGPGYKRNIIDSSCNPAAGGVMAC